jgi:alkylated DNA repair dioxygenase AlkB
MESINILETDEQQKEIKTDIFLKDMHLVFSPSFYSEEKCQEILGKLQKLTFNSDQDSQVFIRGQWIYIPRKQVIFSNPETKKYSFAGTQINGQQWPEFLDEIRDDLNNHLIEWGILSIDSKYRLNHVIVNLYRNGEDYIGYHRDDERDLQLMPYHSSSQEAVIVSLSFGATRDFFLQNIAAPVIKYELPLKNGDLLIIRGETNKKWKHSIPKRIKVKKPRYNLTFRIMKIVS